VDPSSHNTNPFGVFDGPAFNWMTEAAERDAEALAAVRRFIDEVGSEPAQDSWAAAGMRPSEKTIRNRFGSFRNAIERAILAQEGDRSLPA
jgi:hypothetical protein